MSSPNSGQRSSLRRADSFEEVQRRGHFRSTTARHVLTGARASSRSLLFFVPRGSSQRMYVHGSLQKKHVRVTLLHLRAAGERSTIWKHASNKEVHSFRVPVWFGCCAKILLAAPLLPITIGRLSRQCLGATVVPTATCQHLCCFTATTSRPHPSEDCPSSRNWVHVCKEAGLWRADSKSTLV